MRILLTGAPEFVGRLLGEQLLDLYRRLPVVDLDPAHNCSSWISRRDAVRMMLFALENEAVAAKPARTSRESWR